MIRKIEANELTIVILNIFMNCTPPNFYLALSNPLVISMYCKPQTSIGLNMCFGYSKEPPRDSFEYPQHMFWLRNKKNNVQLPTFIWGPVCICHF